MISNSTDWAIITLVRYMFYVIYCSHCNQSNATQYLCLPVTMGNPCINNDNMWTYIALYPPTKWCSRRITTPAHKAHIIPETSQLPGEYTAQCCTLSAAYRAGERLVNQLCPHRYTSFKFPGWREAIMIKCTCSRTQVSRSPGFDWLCNNQTC